MYLMSIKAKADEYPVHFFISRILSEKDGARTMNN
jgi:hypothetical protein